MFRTHAAAHLLLEGGHIPEHDDPTPAFQESGEIKDTEIDDEYETLDAVDRKKNAVYRFMRKISCYSDACCTIARELAALHRSGTPLSIRIEAVPISVTTSTPAAEGEYATLGDILGECLNAQFRNLESENIESLWSLTRQKDILFLHAEIQLALFYSLDPSLCPVQGFIGLTKKCCCCCDFAQRCTDYIRHLQSDQYPADEAGLPLFFCIVGTHGYPDVHWALPDPKYIQTRQIDDEGFRKVCRRFAIVLKDLQKALISKIRYILLQLKETEYAPDSRSGLRDDTNKASRHVSLMGYKKAAQSLHEKGQLSFLPSL